MNKGGENIMKKTYAFYAYLNKEDMNLVKAKALKIREQKNSVSQYIASSRAILERIYMSNNDKQLKAIMGEFKHLYTINDAVAFQQLCTDVMAKYKTILSSMKYKSKDKTNLNIKQYIFAFRLIKKDEFLKLIDSYKEQGNKEQKDFIESVINLVQTTNVFEEVQEYIKKKLNYIQKHPVVIKSLTFGSINVLQICHKMMYLEHSAKTNMCFLLNFPNTGKILLKTRYSKKYHGDLNSYAIAITKSNQQKINYQIKFVSNKKIKLILTKEYDDPVALMDNKKIVGIDVNTKHNMFAFNDGHTIMYDWDLVYKEKGLRKYLAKKAYNKSKHHNKEKHHGKETRKREEKQQRRRKFHQDKKSSLAVKYAKAKGFNHIVMEDLNLQELKGVKLKKNKNLIGMNYNHIKDAIHINDLKNSVKSIAEREGLQFSLVNARFTSRTCPHCGCIDEKNRPTQEHFQCVRCGFAANADLVAALNIAMRIEVEYLRKRLETFSKKRGIYEGKKIKDINKYIDIYQKAYKNKEARQAINTCLVRNGMGNINI